MGSAAARPPSTTPRVRDRSLAHILASVGEDLLRDAHGCELLHHRLSTQTLTKQAGDRSQSMWKERKQGGISLEKKENRQPKGGMGGRLHAATT